MNTTDRLCHVYSRATCQGDLYIKLVLLHSEKYGTIPARPTIARMYVKDKWLSCIFDTAGEHSAYLSKGGRGVGWSGDPCGKQVRGTFRPLDAPPASHSVPTDCQSNTEKCGLVHILFRDSPLYSCWSYPYKNVPLDQSEDTSLCKHLHRILNVCLSAQASSYCSSFFLCLPPVAVRIARAAQVKDTPRRVLLARLEPALQLQMRHQACY